MILAVMLHGRRHPCLCAVREHRGQDERRNLQLEVALEDRLVVYLTVRRTAVNLD